MNRVRAAGFAPVYDGESRILILGSFPSVKSREVSFYYGNPQNRFWKTLASVFGAEVPEDIEGKKAFLHGCGIALWDVVESCDIVGSSDASIENVTLAEIPRLMHAAPIEKIFCNGSKAYALLGEHFPQYIDMAEKLPSTSPANPRFSAEVWKRALSPYRKKKMPRGD